MNLVEIEQDMAVPSRAREKAAMLNYQLFAERPPAHCKRPPVIEAGKECCSERCCWKVRLRDEFSKKQWSRDDCARDRRCNECIEDKIAVKKQSERSPFGADTSTATVQTTLDAPATIPPAAAPAATTTTTTTSPPAASAWPAWRFAKRSDSLLHPSVYNIRTAKMEYHRIHRSWLLGDLLRRSPGRGCSSDGTFRLMARTRTDGQARAHPPPPLCAPSPAPWWSPLPAHATPCFRLLRCWCSSSATTTRSSLGTSCAASRGLRCASASSYSAKG